MTAGTEHTLSDERIPKKHGEKVSEVVDLGGPVARIERVTYVGNEWTELTIMVPRCCDEAPESINISLSREQLDKFVGRLSWPK